jgi:hypothetical protein
MDVFSNKLDNLYSSDAIVGEEGVLESKSLIKQAQQQSTEIQRLSCQEPASVDCNTATFVASASKMDYTRFSLMSSSFQNRPRQYFRGCPLVRTDNAGIAVGEEEISHQQQSSDIMQRPNRCSWHQRPKWTYTRVNSLQSDPTDVRGISVQNGPILASTASKMEPPYSLHQRPNEPIPTTVD